MLFIQGVDTVESVLAIRQTAITNLQAGGVTTSWSVGDASASKTITMNTRQVIEEANEFLRLVLPDVYGSRVKRSVPMYL